MTIKEKICEAIRSKLTDAVNDMDFDEVYDAIAESAIENEIGDIEDEAATYISIQARNWTSKFGADDILHELLDEYMR